MAEFSSLNGYMVKDTTARNIAKGRNQAVAFVDYATMIEALNELEKEEYKSGQNIYIGVVGVPDLWVYSVEDIRHTFDYVSDEDFVEKVTSNTTVQVGFFKLAMLEGQKVDLTTVNEQLAEINTEIDGLNESLGVDIKLIDGVPHWSERGADTFNPFRKSQSTITEVYTFASADNTTGMPQQTYVCPDDGTFVFSYGLSDQGNGGGATLTLNGVTVGAIQNFGLTLWGSNIYSSDGIYIVNVKKDDVVTFRASTNTNDGHRNIFCTAYFIS